MALTPHSLQAGVGSLGGGAGAACAMGEYRSRRPFTHAFLRHNLGGGSLESRMLTAHHDASISVPTIPQI